MTEKELIHEAAEAAAQRSWAQYQADAQTSRSSSSTKQNWLLGISVAEILALAGFLFYAGGWKNHVDETLDHHKGDIYTINQRIDKLLPGSNSRLMTSGDSTIATSPIPSDQ